MIRYSWNEKSTEYLKTYYNTFSAENIAKNLKITTTAVYQKAYKLGLKGRINGSWNKGKILLLNEKEIQFLKNNYADYGAKFCANKLNKNVSSIVKIASRLGLKVNVSVSIKNNSELMEALRRHAKIILAPISKANKVLTKEKEAEVVDLYAKGKSSIQIAKIYKCSKPVILKALKNVPKKEPKDYANHISKTQKSGPEHHSWKGGLKSVYDRVRDLKTYWTWRYSVLDRDNNKCISCGSSEKLHSHHIKTLKSLITEYCAANSKTPIELTHEDLNKDFFYDIDNGLTLCEYCHKKWHKDFGRN